TESGTITVTLPDGTTQQLRTAKEMDKQLDGKFDKNGGVVNGDVTSEGSVSSISGKAIVKLETTGGKTVVISNIGNGYRSHALQDKSGTLMHVGDYGWGANSSLVPEISMTEEQATNWLKDGNTRSQIYRNPSDDTMYASRWSTNAYFKSAGTFINISMSYQTGTITVVSGTNTLMKVAKVYSDLNTTKDSNGNLKAASPIVKVFADHIETNDESEGVEMEHLGIGHYLIKGVVGFNADGAWGINNGFVIPQDHNGKNMVLIDYEVRPDGDIEVFVFHQQNADMPERFQNKRIKHLDEDGNPVYYKNYEPCDVPESRWIDMRVEMPSNSIYNLKQAEAER
ncbi:hypothetical protein, partial [Providencia pseudovermicola]